MTKFTTIFLAGFATLAFTACGGSSSSGGSSTPAQPAEPSGPPLSNSGNEIILPGYTYTHREGKTYEMYLSAPGNVMVNSEHTVLSVYDANYNEYSPSNNEPYNYVENGSYSFAAGQYYLTPSCNSKYGCSSFSVQSNVLYNPLAQ